MQAAVLITLHELQLRVRDRSVVTLGLIAPFVLAAIMGLAFGGSTTSDRITIGVVDPAHVATLRASGDRRFVSERSVSAARTAVRTGAIDAALVLPPEFADGTAEAVVIGHRNRPIAEAAATSVGRQLSDRVAGVATHPAAIVDDRTTKEASPLGFFGPSMAILFLYFSVGAGARSLLAERRAGTLARLRVAPIAFRSVVVGKLVAIFLLALASTLALWIATSKLFDASWGSVPGVLALSSAMIFAIGGIASVIAAHAHTEASADGATGMVAFLLALFGGNFFPPGALPDLFEKASRLTPNGAALQAFARLSIDGAPVSQIVPALVVLVAIGLAFGGYGFSRLTARVTDS
jgi:ABC-type Na+ efflux pump permease subunit